MTQDPTTARWHGLIPMSQRIGHHVWVERALFSWLGQWSAAGVEAPVAVHLGECAARHAWHADVLYQRLPELRELDAESLVVAPDAAAESFLAAALTPPEPERTVEALAGYVRVLLPVLLSSYRSLRADASAVSDASVLRWVGFVLRDDAEEWIRGEELLRTLLDESPQVDRALLRQGELEHRLLGCDSFPG